MRSKLSTPSTFSAFQKLRILLTRKQKITLLWMLGFAICTSLFEVLTATIIVLFAQVLNQPEAGRRYLDFFGLDNELSSGYVVLYIAITVGVVYLIKNIVAMAEVFYQNFSIQKMSYHFKNKLLYRYAEIDYGFYLTRNSSLGLQVVGGDAEHIFSTGMISLACILSEGITFLCLIGAIIYMNPTLAFEIFVIGIVLGAVVTKMLLPRFYSFGQRLQEAALFGTQNLIQFFHAFKEIVLLGKQEAFVDAYKRHSQIKSNIQAKMAAINAVPRLVIEIVFVGLFVITIALLCLDHESPVQMLGILGGYLYAGFRLMPGLNRIINQLNTFKANIPSINRVYCEYTSAPEKGNYLNIPGFQFEDRISLRNVSFRYLNTPKDAISNISLDINKGECLGIVGETGSGKSTLVDIILGLLKPSRGTILADDRKPLNSYQWHQMIGYVPQSIYLTDDTIEANIAFGEQEINEERLNSVIEAAQLRKFIDKLPERTKTIIGDRGIRLSGGERQRIAIARALYRNPEVLIFDEATSALDNETEGRLMETIKEVSNNRTVIMIAHRLTTLKDCNRIIVMENGVVKTIYDDGNNGLFAV